MINKTINIIFIICMVLMLNVVIASADDHNQQQEQMGHSNQGRPQAQSARSPSRNIQRPTQQRVQRTSPKPVERHQTIYQVKSQPEHRTDDRTHVHAVPAARPGENNRLFHRQHHKNWRPRYNFYDNQYHFYPYVNIAETVELSSDCYAINFNGETYYYDQGTFYIQDNSGQYVAIVPPLGIIVNPIVAQARQIVVNGQVLYRYKGVFYVQVTEGYQVVEPVQTPSDDS